MEPILFTSLAELLRFLEGVRERFTREEFEGILHAAKKYWKNRSSDEEMAEKYWNSLMKYMDKLEISFINEALKKIGGK